MSDEPSAGERFITLIRRLKDYQFAQVNVGVFKELLDSAKREAWDAGAKTMAEACEHIVSSPDYAGSGFTKGQVLRMLLAAIRKAKVPEYRE